VRSTKAVRHCALGLTAAFLTLGLAACGGGGQHADSVSKGSLVSKMKADPEFKETKPAAVTCLAGVMLQYGDKGDLQGYVKGSVKADDIKGLNGNKKAETAGSKCAALDR
jgi:hypothetical protein